MRCPQNAQNKRSISWKQRFGDGCIDFWLVSIALSVSILHYSCTTFPRFANMKGKTRHLVAYLAPDELFPARPAIPPKVGDRPSAHLSRARPRPIFAQEPSSPLLEQGRSSVFPHQLSVTCFLRSSAKSFVTMWSLKALGATTDQQIHIYVPQLTILPSHVSHWSCS